MYLYPFTRQVSACCCRIAHHSVQERPHQQHLPSPLSPQHQQWHHRHLRSRWPGSSQNSSSSRNVKHHESRGNARFVNALIDTRNADRRYGSAFLEATALDPSQACWQHTAAEPISLPWTLPTLCPSTRESSSTASSLCNFPCTVAFLV